MSLRALGAALVLGIALGALVQGWRMGEQLATARQHHADELLRISQASQEAADEQRSARMELERRLDQNDTDHYKELTHAQDENARLALELRAADRRLSIRTAGPACPAAGVPAPARPGRLDDGAQRADIHPQDAADLVAIAGDANACAMKLAALQGWAREVVMSQADQ